MDRHRLLLTGVGAAAPGRLAQTVRESFADDFFLIGCDTNPRHLVACTPDLDRFVQVPPFKDESYRETMLNIMRDQEIDIFVPLFDQEACLFHRDHPDLAALNVVSTAPTRETCNVYIDKKRTSQFLDSTGMPIPYAFALGDVDSGQEYFIKPKHGFGSVGARKIEGEHILKMDDADEYLIQEILEPPEVTVEIFHANSRISTVARQRLETKAGVCTKARVYFDEFFDDLVQKLYKKLEIPMVANIQFMRSRETDNWKITDLNMRFAGGSALSRTAGWDIFSAFLASYSARPLDPFSFLKLRKPEQYVVRAYHEIALDP